MRGIYTTSEFLKVIKDEGSFPFQLDGIDTVFIVPCASGQAKGYVTQVTTWRFELDKEGFKTYMKEAPKAKKVLLLSECCNFTSWLIDEVKEAYPNIEWVIPKTRDYCANMKVEHVRSDLLSTHVLKELQQGCLF